jgi:phenylacetate-CoA ligase
VKEGDPGELVITTLTKEALPMVRYRSRDITRMTREPCSCGRTHVRILRVTGRDDDMMIIRGVNVFPTQVEEIVLAHERLSGLYQVHVRREGLLDEVEVHCELDHSNAAVDEAERKAIAGWVQDRVKTLVGISTTVRVFDPDSIERTQTGKARRVIDTRPR